MASTASATVLELYSTAQLCGLAGITFRVADYADRVGLIVPHVPAKGSGSHRRWTRRQVQTMWALGQIAGYNHRHKAAAALLEAGEFRGVLIVTRTWAQVCTDATDVMLLLTEPGTFTATVVNLDECPVPS